MSFFSGLSIIITLVTLVIVFAGVGLAGWMVYSKILKPRSVRNRLLQTGSPGKAKILGIADTGVIVNRRYHQVLLTVEVSPEGHFQKPYQTQLKTLVGVVEMPQYQPGKEFKIRYNPENLAEVAFEAAIIS